MIQVNCKLPKPDPAQVPPLVVSDMKIIKRSIFVRVTLIVILLGVMINSCSQSGKDDLVTFDECISLARQHSGSGDNEKAIMFYKKAVAAKPENADAHYELGTAYLREWQRTFDSAQKKVISEVFNDPNRKITKNHTQALIALGLKNEYKGLAVKEFQEAIRYDPNNWAAHFELGSFFLSDKQYLKAIDELSKVIIINPDYANGHSLLGEAFLKIGQYESAVANLRKSIELNPSGYTYYKLGLTYRKMNKGKELYEVLQKLKSMKSTFYDELRLVISSGDESEEN
ncbi:MAG: tetratricopeptide repeat protein [Nitrospirota bacterium]|nr:tetratricopeptide repeat protein [Nitrospirota bacterium]